MTISPWDLGRTLPLGEAGDWIYNSYTVYTTLIKIAANTLHMSNNKTCEEMSSSQWEFQRGKKKLRD